MVPAKNVRLRGCPEDGSMRLLEGGRLCPGSSWDAQPCAWGPTLTVGNRTVSQGYCEDRMNTRMRYVHHGVWQCNCSQTVSINEAIRIKGGLFFLQLSEKSTACLKVLSDLRMTLRLAFPLTVLDQCPDHSVWTAIQLEGGGPPITPQSSGWQCACGCC